MKKRLRCRWLMTAALSLLLWGCAVPQSEKAVETESLVQSLSETAETNGISKNQTESSRDIFAMDTYMTVTAYGERAEEAVNAAVSEIERLDALLSTGSSESEVSIVNANSGGILTEETGTLLQKSLELYEDTNGAFDVAIYPIMKEWGFTDGHYQVPDSEKLAALLEVASPSLIQYNNETREVSFKKEGVQIDFGAIAKGYTSAKIMDIFREYGIEHGIVNLGGNVQVLGKKADGTLWRVAIQNPNGSDDYLGVIELENKAVITSGGYERYFEQDGVRYHHIIDPTTGYPADSGLISVSIVTEDGMLADGLSTSLFVMGKEKAIDYWRNHSEQFDMILVDEDSKIYVSEGIADTFTTEYAEIIEREE